MTASSETNEIEETKEEKKPGLELEEKFGFTLDELYRIGTKVYREKEKSEFHVTYDERIKLAAYAKQVKCGKYTPNGDQETGFFDWIGNDRRQAWQSLGDMSKDTAMAGFVSLLDQVCPPFRDFIEVRKREIEEQTRLEQEEVQRQKKERSQFDDEEKLKRQEQEKLKFEAQKQQIQDALNQQTFHQFRAYADQQFAGDPDQQEKLVKQLQEQHYQQYMSQVYAQQSAMQQPNSPPTDELAQCHLSNRNIKEQDETDESGSEKSDSEQSVVEELPSNPAIAPASMWTRKDIQEFKNVIRKESSEGVIKVGHGETVTVRVPTHEEGTCLFWEFATDSYDIGFGVYFEWTIAENNTVSVHISESSDEDEELPNESPAGASGQEREDDAEKGSLEREKAADKPQIDEIVPVYRRDCHEEVYAGSHVYPGRGVYLLKFDNSYSLWRSKSLYYRVYYSK